MSPLQVVFAPERERFELLRDGEVLGYADVDIKGKVVTVPYVEIRPDLQGQGLGAILVRRMVDELRSSGKEVVPICGFAARVIRQMGSR